MFHGHPVAQWDYFQELEVGGEFRDKAQQIALIAQECSARGVGSLPWTPSSSTMGLLPGVAGR